MNSFPSEAKFRYSWRNYQQTVLDKLDSFLSDKHLHIIAPPGSGKTVLGLESMLRINKPTIVFSPTLTIRNQWINRLCELFLDTNQAPEWISTDIRNPSFLTVVTYQGLFAACKDPSQTKEIIRKLKKQQVEVFILDEAHHLKNQWWIVLNEVKKSISPIIIGLTATPPYDSSYIEWQRYLQMNGDIDLEITVPELIREKDLCPHQDYVYFSYPTQDEYQRIEKYRKDISSLYEQLSKSQKILSAIQESELWKNPKNYLSWIYENTSIYSSILIFLLENNVDVSPEYFFILGLTEEDLHEKYPRLNIQHLEKILNYILFEDKLFFNQFEDEKNKLRENLKRRGVIEQGLINFRENSGIDKLLISSNSKLKSIEQIAQFEYDSLKNDLRMLILSDYIREEYLNSSVDQIKKLGVIPIFKNLLDANLTTDKIGVLTGSLVILPLNALHRFECLCNDNKISLANNYFKNFDKHHFIVTNNSALKDSLVNLVTQLFTEGYIEILIGTKSLLGEGWDAPAVNSLILASFVGSFMLSNQMRGRAIRTQKDNLTKTSNIWHLVCIDPTITTGGEDLDILSRRFQSFVGISSNTEELYIDNNLSRLNVSSKYYTTDFVNNINKKTFALAQNRDELAQRWNSTLEHGLDLVDAITIPRPDKDIEKEQDTEFLFYKDYQLLASGFITVLSSIGYTLMGLFSKNVRWIKSVKDLLLIIMMVATGWLFFFIIINRKRIIRYIKKDDITKDYYNIGRILMLSLIELNVLKTPSKNLSLSFKDRADGSVMLKLEGARKSEQSIFISAFKEIIAEIDNPKYIILQKRKRWKMNQDRYYTLPSIISNNKKNAMVFADIWNNILGRSELIYTRTIEGRKILLKARIDSYSLTIDGKSKEFSKWE